MKKAVFIVLLACMLAALPATVFAQPEEPPDQPQQTEEPDPGWHAPRKARRHPVVLQALAEKVAEGLGLPIDEFKERVLNGETPLEVAQSEGMSEDDFHSLLKESQYTLIDEALAEGRITEEQAAALRQRVEAGEGLRVNPRERLRNLPGSKWLLPALAQQAGVDVDEIRQRLAAGETLPEVLEDLGIDREDVRSAMEELGIQALENAEENGWISPERAEKLQEENPLRPFRWLQNGAKRLKEMGMRLFQSENQP